MIFSRVEVTRDQITGELRFAASNTKITLDQPSAICIDSSLSATAAAEKLGELFDSLTVRTVACCWGELPKELKKIEDRSILTGVRRTLCFEGADVFFV